MTCILEHVRIVRTKKLHRLASLVFWDRGLHRSGLAMYVHVFVPPKDSTKSQESANEALWSTSLQITELKRGTEMVVCTPGRMIDILVTSGGKITNLRRVTYLVCGWPWFLLTTSSCPMHASFVNCRAHQFIAAMSGPW